MTSVEGGDPEGRDDVLVTLAPSLIHAGGRRVIRGVLTIGSSEDADVVLPRDLAASTHARLVRSGGALAVSDESGIGTLVNGEPLVGQTREVRGGDRITVGGEHFFVADGREEHEPEIGGGRGLQQRLTIGSGDCDVVLDHPSVAPLHAVLAPSSGQALLSDRSRGSGLLVDGVTVDKAVIGIGSEVGIGPYRLVFDGSRLIARSFTGSRLDVAEAAVQIGGTQILSPVTVSVEPGELTAIIGESGAGKSTLLRLMAGVQEPSNGRVLLAGDDIGERLRELGYVPQTDIVHKGLTVGEALEYAGRLRLPRDTPAATLQRSIDSIIFELELADRRHARIGDLSGGERKRAGVATELLSRPSVLLLDEPTTGLDPGLERRTMELLRRLASGGRSVTLVTHATRSISVCDKLIVLGPGGLLCFVGAPNEALAFFDVGDFDEIYDRISGGSVLNWTRLFEASELRARQRRFAALEASRTRAQRKGETVPRKSAVDTGPVLTSRYLRVFLRDQRNVALLLAQPFVLGAAAALIIGSDALSGLDTTRNGTNLVFLLTTIAVWLGSIAAVREIVKERAVVARELAVGVPIPAYLASKVGVLGVVGAIQVAALACTTFALAPPDAPAGQILLLVLCLLLAAWTAIAMGLAISTFANTEDQATSLIPLALIPQLLLGGALVAVAAMATPVKIAAAFTITRWFFAGAGSAIDLDQRIAADPVFGPVSEYGSDFFELSAASVLLVTVLFVSGFLAIAAIGLRSGRLAGAE